MNQAIAILLAGMFVGGGILLGLLAVAEVVEEGVNAAIRSLKDKP